MHCHSAYHSSQAVNRRILFRDALDCWPAMHAPNMCASSSAWQQFEWNICNFVLCIELQFLLMLPGDLFGELPDSMSSQISKY
jgi:hypothetical protein